MSRIYVCLDDDFREQIRRSEFSSLKKIPKYGYLYTLKEISIDGGFIFEELICNVNADGKVFSFNPYRFILLEDYLALLIQIKESLNSLEK